MADTPKVPLSPIDYESIEKNVKWFLELDKFGHGVVEIVHGTEKILVPKRFYDFCLTYDIKPHQAINMIVSDFIVKYYHGNGSYEQGMVNRVRCADLTEEERSKFLKVLLEET